MKTKTYLPLKDVTNLYSQFSQLSPEDKKIANKKTMDKVYARKAANKLKLKSKLLCLH